MLHIEIEITEKGAKELLESLKLNSSLFILKGKNLSLLINHTVKPHRLHIVNDNEKFGVAIRTSIDEQG